MTTAYRIDCIQNGKDKSAFINLRGEWCLTVGEAIDMARDFEHKHSGAEVLTVSRLAMGANGLMYTDKLYAQKLIRRA